MPWWKNASSSPPKSSSPIGSSDSSSSMSRRQRRPGVTLFSRRDSRMSPPPHNYHHQQQQPRLTRARKLRHLDIDIESAAACSRDSPEGSKPSVSRSESSLDFPGYSARSSSSSVLPHPLPLPDLSPFFRRGESAGSSPSNCCRLPSPDSDYLAREIGGIGEKVSSISVVGSRLAHQTMRKSTDHNDVVGITSGLNRRRTPDLNAGGNVQSNFRLNVPAKSAPASGFSSPVRSPRRMSTGDFFPYPYMGSQGPQVWSAPDIPSDMMTGFSPQTSPEILFSPERSPLYSPTGKSHVRKSRNLSGSTSPLHPRMSPDNSSGKPDCAGSPIVHPLPLPPGAAGPSPPAFVAHQAPPIAESSSATSQWVKGKLIGSGTFGHVYAATNRQTGAMCAMKEVNLIPDDPKSAECMRQLEQEIKFLSQLKHPNIVQYYGSEIAEDRFYIFLEYVYPGSINKYVREHVGAITESVVRNFTRHILSGLAYLHSKMTMHRDIKGANLLVDASGVVKLADFGMAKHLSGAAPALSLKGSPHWMAPEVMQAMMQNNSVGYDLAVDIWSLGCTIIEMFTRKPPWAGIEGAAAMFKVLHGCPTIPENLSPEGKEFLNLCFQRNPADRPSAAALLDHPFIRNSHQEIPSYVHAFSGMKLTGTELSPRERTKFVGDSAAKGKVLSNSDNDQSHPETSESAASRLSPRSTLETLPNLSPPQANHSPSPPLNGLSGIHRGAANHRMYSLPKAHHGKEVLHLF
ncbi:Mitogen-activated protein kinase kinase kinase YODA [Acorus gramineus]|uniref:mitogen-activated protein kinase kinase kinase n=1 Tax=Acorus gramineus TaxID=55184 RepID=A0AAV9BK96_ACOGR|nr:Mitogen-activated protein kinase kinase kinase YODA [Acorus gramineus]